MRRTGVVRENQGMAMRSFNEYGPIQIFFLLRMVHKSVSNVPSFFIGSVFCEGSISTTRFSSSAFSSRKGFLAMLRRGMTLRLTGGWVLKRLEKKPSPASMPRDEGETAVVTFDVDAEGMPVQRATVETGILQEGLFGNQDPAEAYRGLQRVTSSCVACHMSFRVR